MEQIEGILIDLRHHNDTTDVVTLFTRTRGRLAFTSTAGNTPKGRRRRALLQPLSIISSQSKIQENKNLHRLGSFEMKYVTPDIYYNPYKRTIATFLADFLNHLLRASAPDPKIYNLLTSAILRLDRTHRLVANYHLALLVELLQPMGIIPDISGYQPNYPFNMQLGEYTPVIANQKYGDSTMCTNKSDGSPIISPTEAAAIPSILRLSTSNCHAFKLNRNQRKQILSYLLTYYSHHFPGTEALNSPAVLNALFD